MDICERCGTAVVSAVTPSGGAVQIDPQSSDEGTLMLVNNGNPDKPLAIPLLRAGAATIRLYGVPLFSVHAMSCVSVKP